MSEIFKQIKDRYKLDLERNGIKYELWAIDDTEHKKLSRDNGIQISHKSKFCFNLAALQYNKEGEYLNLAELFTVLEWLFGESSISYDIMETSFRFHILLVIKREKGVFFYILDVFDIKGYMHLNLYKIIENTALHNYNKSQGYPHLNSEFPQEEINHFFHYFYGFLIGYFRTNKRVTAQKNFLRTVIDNFILYGYKDGEYFEEDYETEEIYREQIELFEKTYGVFLYKTDVSDVLQTITNMTSIVD